MATSDPTVTLPSSVLRQYEAVSLFNSPYPAHDEGRAIDLYPGERREATARSPVAGEVLETRSAKAPSKPFAADEDHLIVLDTGERLARVLHVEPVVTTGDRVDVGDVLGTTVRSGYFDPWVADHLHLGFRPQGTNPHRASGSLRIALEAGITPVPWDGTGIVAERGDTYARIDLEGCRDADDTLVGIAVESGPGGGVLDGGLPHYDRGGVVGRTGNGGTPENVRFLDDVLGTPSGRTLPWGDREVVVDGRPIHGLSLSLQRGNPSVRLVDPDGVPVAAGERVVVSLRCAE